MIYENIKIAHLVLDALFIDTAYYQFEIIAPGCSDYFTVKATNGLKHIKQTPVKLISKNAYKDRLFHKTLTGYDFVILHGLSGFNTKLVLNAPQSIKFLWIGWGVDYYDLINNAKDDLYLEETKAIAHLFDKEKSLINYIKSMIKRILKIKNKKQEAIPKIKYFAPVLNIEYNLVAEKTGNDIPELIDWNYGVSALFLKNENYSEYIVSGNDILLGNSATLTNNHIEIINLLSRNQENINKIICPLSYGDPHYAQYISDYGGKKLGRAFVSLREFLPMENYMGIISKCSNVIMNHIRQQGVGNVNMMAYLGAKIFLNEHNPLYEHYTSKGFKIFTIKDIEDNPNILNEPLPIADVENNRNLVKYYYNEDVMIDKTKNLIDTLLSSKK